jgi:hypothetical protein
MHNLAQWLQIVHVSAPVDHILHFALKSEVELFTQPSGDYVQSIGCCCEQQEAVVALQPKTGSKRLSYKSGNATRHTLEHLTDLHVHPTLNEFEFKPMPLTTGTQSVCAVLPDGHLTPQPGPVSA